MKKAGDAFIKQDQDKSRVDLIPALATLEVGRVMGHGAKKYDVHNWRNVDDRARYLAAAERHLLEYKSGKDLDDDSGMMTLAHAAASVLMLLECEIDGLGEDTRAVHR